MIPVGIPSADLWKITPEAKAKYDQQFYQLQPINGFITGDQAKNLFLQSGLPPQILAQIWSLADRNADGKMDISEFALAMHMIQMKLKGLELPKALPQPTVISAAAYRPVAVVPAAAVTTKVEPLASGFVKPASPIDAKLQRSSSISSQDSPTMAAALTEWAVSQQSKLKYTQLFNCYDQMRIGYLTGNQAKSLLVGTGLQQQILAQIWALADIDNDGRLSCEEFVLAMHLADSVKVGDALPRALPLELIPPSHRRKRSASIVSTSSTITSHVQMPISDALLLGDVKDDKLLQQTTFEDKRRENFEKGQAELEKRRMALLENQRKEQEERDRKEREEQERRERIRQEQEKRRQLEMEKQLAKQRELEQEKEEQRRKALEQREAARREMERQRQLEWEKQRQQELLSQRQKEQETVCHLKNRNKNLTYELEQLAGKITNLNEHIVEIRKGVTDMKSSIDIMRVERDSKLSDMNEVKAKIKEMNDRLLIISQEKITLKAQLEEVNQANPSNDSNNVVMHNFNNKQIVIHKLQNSLDNIEKESVQKQSDIENSNAQLEDLKEKLTELVSRHKNLYQEYEEKRQRVLSMKKSKENGLIKDQDAALDDAWGPPEEVAAEGNGDWNAEEQPNEMGVRYRILYAFDSRNPDELNIMPGDIVLVPEGQSSEPGWLGGSLHGKTGWFPEAYAEKLDGISDNGDGDVEGFDSGVGAAAEAVHIVGTEMKRTLEGISEAPENTVEADKAVKDVLQHSENSSFTQLPKTNQVTSPTSAESPVLGESQAVPDGLQAQAQFPWKAKKENHLSFNKGDIITVKEQQDIWWYGEFQGQLGWFPKSYVKLISGPARTNEIVTETTDVQPEVPSQPPGISADFYVATYAYQSEEPGDLCFQSGDIIQVIAMDGEWWTGVIENRNGIFPNNYVRKLEPHEIQNIPPSVLQDSKSVSPLPLSSSEGGKKKAEIVAVIAAYHATGTEQLSLEKNQLVHVRKKSPSGWWEGELQMKGRKRQVGWFPASYVRPHIGSAASSARSTPEPITPVTRESFLNGINQLPSRTNEQVVALYPFMGSQDDELTFQKGDMITLLNNDDPTWWKGELNGVTGIFPAAYVEFTGKSANK